jgi:integrase
MIRDAMSCLKDLYASLPVCQFSPKRLKAVREAMIAKDWTRRHVNKQVGRVRRIFKWGVSEELVPPSVFHGLQTVEPLRKGRSEARETKPVKPVADEVVNATLPYLSPVVRAMVQVQRFSACRPGEVCRMRACEIDRSGDVWLYRPAQHKTDWHDHERCIVIGPQAQAVLLPFIDAHKADEYLFQPREAVQGMHDARSANRKTPIAYGNRPGTNRKAKPERKPGEVYGRHAYGHAIATACRRAGVAHWAPNQLRHSAATKIRKRYGLEGSQVACGHRQADVTQIYAERDLALARRIALDMG